MRAAQVRFPILALAITLAGCQPPAAENYVDRKPASDQKSAQASAPLPSPDAQGAVWAEAASAQRLLYGKPGEQPLFALACIEADGGEHVQFTRYAPADEGAKAFMALIGNGHVARLKVDATEMGEATLWQGSTPVGNDRLEVLTGRNAVEATIPGAGTLRLNASNAPARLIDACRAAAEGQPSDAPDRPANPE
ncbi:hypothetical protein [Altererythrobacter sp. MF3-039]|uniref:hypothetical protein n=1 Tax=Altererythrobacter sp. MF3-039 TaxID=3252901 RepID=UPI00390C5719